MADPKQYDIGITNQAFDSDESLKTAITVSLLSWARAEPGDVVPDAEDLQGWWGDTYSRVSGDQFGSRLWTLIGRPITAQLLSEFETLCREALQWLIDDGVIATLEFQVEQIGLDTVGARIGVRRPRDTSLTWLDRWEMSLAV